MWGQEAGGRQRHHVTECVTSRVGEKIRCWRKINRKQSLERELRFVILCVCVCVCMYVCMCVFVCMCKHVCVYIHTYVSENRTHEGYGRVTERRLCLDGVAYSVNRDLYVYVN